MLDFKALSLAVLLVAAPGLARADGMTGTQALCFAAKLLGDPAACSTIDRAVVVGEVVHYSARIRVGPGEHDRIGLHRVVREESDDRPARAADSVLAVHGDAWGFVGAFMSSGPDSFAVHLAENDIDVWGVDLRWVGVPATAADFAFMADWGMSTYVGDIGRALLGARLTRGLTGSGFRRMTLLGWSRGAALTYAYADREAGVPGFLRQVDGIVPVDVSYRIDPSSPELIAGACARAAATRALIDAGTFETATGSLLNVAGQLAALLPYDPSPIVPGLTNEQTALLVGAATFTFAPPGQAAHPVYHFNAGVFDAFGIPSALQFVSTPTFTDYLQGTSPFQSLRDGLDHDDLLCGEIDSPFDDHLSEIEVPVLYVGAQGGFGTDGVYSTTLLGSTDVTTHVVQLLPDELRIADFGHADLFVADNAEALAWQAIADWISTH